MRNIFEIMIKNITYFLLFCSFNLKFIKNRLINRFCEQTLHICFQEYTPLAIEHCDNHTTTAYKPLLNRLVYYHIQINENFCYVGKTSGKLSHCLEQTL